MTYFILPQIEYDINILHNGIIQKNILIHMNLFIQIFLIQKTLFVKLSLFLGLFLN